MAHNYSSLTTRSGGGRLREETKETVDAVVRHLRSGKAPKEIAFTLRISWSYVQAIIYRHRQVRSTYIETYRLRHPNQAGPPQRIIQPLKTAEL